MNLFSYIVSLVVISVAIAANPSDLSASDADGYPLVDVHSLRLDTPLKILHKPKPSWGDGLDCSVGTVILRIEFLKSGEIGKISIVKGITKNRNEASIEAAKGIKFQPATKDGESITVFKQIEFSFSLY